MSVLNGVGASQESVLTTVGEWVADPACSGNATTLLVCGMIYANEENYVEALKACHTGLSLEMCGPSPLCQLHDCVFGGRGREGEGGREYRGIESERREGGRGGGTLREGGKGASALHCHGCNN